MNVRLGVVGAALVLLSVGCSSGSGTPDGGGGTPSLTVSPQGVTVVAGSAAVGITATLTGASGTITWTLSGPGSLSATSGTTTSYTPPATVTASTTATVTASAAGLTASASVTITSNGTITVAGKVLEDDGLPIPGVTVVIGTQTTTSATDGTFTIPDVKVPYDLMLFEPNVQVTDYQGLTRPDPTVMYYAYRHDATVTGTINVGGADPIGTVGETTEVAWASPLIQTEGQSIAANPYSIDLSFYSATQTTGQVHALQWTNGSTTQFLPTSFNGYGVSSAVTATVGSSVTADITLAPVTSATFSFSVTLPDSSAYSIAGGQVAAVFDDGALIGVGEVNGARSTDFSFLVPSVADETISATATAVYTLDSATVAICFVTSQGNAPATSGLVLNVPEAPLPALPADGTPDVTAGPNGTVFSWTPFDAGVTYINLSPKNFGPGPTFVIITNATSTTIPDLSSLGQGLPDGGTYTWSVNGFGPWANMDAYAGGTSLPATATVFNCGTISAGYRTFITAPQ